MLALEHASAPLPRPDLARKLWKDGADGSLRTALNELRGAFREAGVDPDRYLVATEGRRGRIGTICLRDVASVDALEFEAAAQAGDSHKMLELAPATFLAGLASPGDHLTGVRRRYARLEADACERVATEDWAAGRPEAAIALAERRCELIPTDSRAIVTLMGYLRERGELERATAVGRDFVRRARADANPVGGVPAALDQLASEGPGDASSDPGDGLAPGAPPPGPTARTWPAPLRNIGRAAAAFFAVIGLLVVAAIVVSSGDGGDSGATAEPLGLTDCDPTELTEPSERDLAAREIETPTTSNPRPVGEVIARSRPRTIAVSSDYVWLTQSTDGSVWRIDPELERPVGQPYPVGGTPYSVAVAEDAIWITREDGVLVQLNRATGEIEHEIDYGAVSGEVAIGSGAVWVNIFDGRHAGSIARIDPCDQSVSYYRAGTGANTVIHAYGHLWVSDSAERAVHRIDPETGKVDSIALDVTDPQDLGAANGEVLVAHYGPKRLTRIDAESLERVGDPIEIGAGAAGVAAGAGAIWVPNYEGDSVSRIDLDTFESDPEAASVGDSPTDIAVGHGRVWVPNNDSEPPTVTAITP